MQQEIVKIRVEINEQKETKKGRKEQRKKKQRIDEMQNFFVVVHFHYA